MNPLEYYARFMDDTALAVFDRRLKLVDANQAFVSAFGENSDLSLDRVLADMEHSEGVLPSLLYELELQGRTSPVSLALNTDKYRFIFRVSLFRLGESDGDMVLASFRDETEKGFMEQTLRDRNLSLVTISPGIPVGFFRAARSGNIISVNRPLVDMLGYENEYELFNASIGDTWVDPSDRERMLQNLMDHDTVSGMEAQWMRRDKGRLWVSISAYGVSGESGETLVFDAVILDITKRKEAEDELRRYRNRLQEMVDEKTGELTKSNDMLVLEVAERQKSETVQSVLYAITDAAVTAQSLFRLLEEIHAQMSRLFYTPNLYFAFYDPADNSYSFPYAIDQQDGAVGFTIPGYMEGTLTDLVRTTGEPLLVDRATYAELLAKGKLREVGSPSEQWIGVPLRDSSGVWGVLATQSYEMVNAYSREDLVLFARIAEHVALAISRHRAEQELRRNGALFRAVLEAENRGIIVTDSDGMVVYINPVLSREMEIPPEHVRGRELSNILHSEDQIPLAEAVENWKRGGARPALLRILSGACTVNAQPLRDATGRLLGMIAIEENIDEIHPADLAEPSEP
ncbi:MAG: PAS domain S-box protein [Candidatus Fermentibacteraceae bacterium]